MSAQGTARHDLRALAGKLANASDKQVTDAVRMIDAMADRGAADNLLVPLRPRLAQLRPPRPLNFVRLLFTPLDGVIVPGPRWRPGAPTVPRPALMPMAEVVCAAGLDSGAADRAIAQCSGGTGRGEEDRVIQIGAELWPCAAEILARAAPPASWRDMSGLADACFAPLACGVATVLRHGAALLRLPGLGPAAQDESIAVMVADAAVRAPDATGLMAAALMARLPGAAARILATLPRQRSEDVIGQVLDGLEDEVGQSVGPASALAHEAAFMLDLAAKLPALEDGTRRPDLRRRTQEIRRDAEAICRRRVADAASRELPGRLAALPPEAGDADVAALEATARDLRRLEQAGRKLGGGAAAYGTALSQAAAALTCGDAARLTLADQVRLVEILLGSEAALAMSRRCGAP